MDFVSRSHINETLIVQANAKMPIGIDALSFDFLPTFYEIDFLLNDKERLQLKLGVNPLVLGILWTIKEASSKLLHFDNIAAALEIDTSLLLNSFDRKNLIEEIYCYSVYFGTRNIYCKTQISFEMKFLVTCCTLSINDSIDLEFDLNSPLVDSF